MIKKTLIFFSLIGVTVLISGKNLKIQSPELNLKEVLTLAESLSKADIISDESKQLLSQWAQKRFSADSIELPANMDIATRDGILFFCGWRAYLDMLDDQSSHYSKIFKPERLKQMINEDADAFKRMRSPKEFVEMAVSGIDNSTGIGDSYKKPLMKFYKKLVKDLTEIRLVDTKVVNEARALMDEQKINMNYQAFVALGSRRQFYRTYPILKARQIDFFKALEEMSALEAGGADKLAASYQDFQFLNAYDIVPHMSNAYIFEINPAESIRESYLRAMKEVAQINPGLQTQGLNLEIQRQEDRGMMAMFHIIFTYKIKGVIQRKIIATGLDKEDLAQGKELENQVMGIVSDWNTVVEVFNHMLTEKGNDRRVFSMIDPAFSETPTEVSFFSLNKASYELWEKAEDNNLVGISELTAVSYDKRLSASGRRKLAAAYRRMGLLNHLSESVYRSAARQAAKGYATDLREVMLSFPDVIYDFESSGFVSMTPYQDLIEGMGKVSKRAFITTNPLDNYEAVYAEDEDSLVVSFTFKDSIYQVGLKYEEGEMDMSIIDYINQIMEAWNRKGRFYHLRGGGIVYFTTNQYNFLKKDQAELFEE